jgi:uncharacterized membrane protein
LRNVVYRVAPHHPPCVWYPPSFFSFLFFVSFDLIWNAIKKRRENKRKREKKKDVNCPRVGSSIKPPAALISQHTRQ